MIDLLKIVYEMFTKDDNSLILGLSILICLIGCIAPLVVSFVKIYSNSDKITEQDCWSPWEKAAEVLVKD